MTPTIKDITEATEELHEAMLEAHKAHITEDNAKLARIKAHKRLTLARDTIRNLTFNN